MSKRKVVVTILACTVVVAIIFAVAAIMSTKEQKLEPPGVGITAQSMEQLVTDELTITIDEEAGGFDQGALIRATEDYCKSNGITGEVTVVACDMLDSGVFKCVIKYDSTAADFEFNLSDYKL